MQIRRNALALLARALLVGLLGTQAGLHQVHDFTGAPGIVRPKQALAALRQGDAQGGQGGKTR